MLRNYKSFPMVNGTGVRDIPGDPKHFVLITMVMEQLK